MFQVVDLETSRRSQAAPQHKERAGSHFYLSICFSWIIPLEV